MTKTPPPRTDDGVFSQRETSAAVALALVVTGQRCRPGALAARAVVNGVTHYIADRRKPLLKMAEWRGKKGWVDNDPNAAYQLDQSWHIFWLFAGAAIDAVVARQKAD